MLIKSADDKSSQIALLESLLTTAPATKRSRIEQAIRNLRAGIKGEQEAAYQLEFAYKDSPNWAVLNDLRLEFGGRVAQIDHLLINRSMCIYVIETKHFHAGVKITDEGEFLRWNDHRKTYEGMPSPLAQNARHLQVVREVFDDLKVPTRLGVRMIPKYFSYVAVSPNARIDRPSRFDTRLVVKADALHETIQRDTEASIGLKEAMTVAFRVVDQGTLVGIARQFLARHKPIEPNWAASFGLSEPSAETKAPEPPAEAFPEPPAPSVPGISSGTGQSTGPRCKACGGTAGRIEYGKYGYYFQCAACEVNTSAKVQCHQPGHQARVRKDGPRFFRECQACGSSELYFVNP